MSINGIHRCESPAPQVRRAVAREVAFGRARAEARRAIIADSRLSGGGTARAVLATQSYRNRDSGRCDPSQSTVGARAGLSVTTIRRALLAATETGVVERLRRRGRAGRWRSTQYGMTGDSIVVERQLAAAGLLRGAVRTGVEIVDRASMRDGVARVTERELAGALGVDERTIRRHTRRLRDCGHLELVRDGHWAITLLRDVIRTKLSDGVRTNLTAEPLVQRNEYHPYPPERRDEGRLCNSGEGGVGWARLRTDVLDLLETAVAAERSGLSRREARLAARRSARYPRALWQAAAAAGRSGADPALLADLAGARPLVEAGIDAVEALGRVVEARQSAAAPERPAAGPFDWYAGRMLHITRRQALDLSRALGDVVPGPILHALAAAADAALADPAGAHWRRTADDRLGLALAWIAGAARELVAEAAARVGLAAESVVMGAAPPCDVPRPAAATLAAGATREQVIGAIAERLEIEAGLHHLPARRPDAVTVRRAGQAITITLAGRPVTGADVEAARGNADAVDADLVAAAATLADPHADRLGRGESLRRAFALLEARGWEHRPAAALSALPPPARRAALLDAGPAADQEGFRWALGGGRLADVVAGWHWLPPDAAATVGAALTAEADHADARAVAAAVERAVVAASDLASDVWERDPADRVAAVMAAARAALDVHRQFAGFLAAQRDREATERAAAAARRNQIRELADAARRRHQEGRA